MSAPRWTRVARAGLLAALACRIPAPVQAAPPEGGAFAHIELVGDTDGSLAARVRAELVARGFVLFVAPAFEPADPFAPGVAAVLRVESPRRRVEIWTRDPEGGGARFRTALVARDDTDRTTPVRIAEGVRAFLALSPARAPLPASLAVNAAPPPAGARPRRGAVAAAAAVLAPADGASAGGGLLLRARIAFSSRVLAGVRVNLPIVPATISSAGDSATLRSSLMIAEVSVPLYGRSRDSRWGVEASAGAGAAWLRTSGTAALPLRGRSDDRWVGVGLAAVEFARRLSARTSLSATFAVGFAMPSVKIRFGGTEVANWGAPLGLFALGWALDL